MLKYLYFFLIISIPLLIGCAGTETLEVDKVPPLKPNVIEHLGDTGDVLGLDTLNYHNNSEYENNGIDATQGGDWIQIEWDHIIDTDIEIVEIYRFSLQEYNAYVNYLQGGGEEYDFTTRVGQISPELDRYEDNSPGLLGKNSFYYIKPIDEAGNWTKSDTVCYKLIDKPALIYPTEPGSYQLNGLVFQWELPSGYSVSNSRLLIFTENYELLWKYDPLDYEQPSIEYDGPDVDVNSIRWRVEVFGNTVFSSPVNGKVYIIYAGSESEDVAIFIE
ncbi:MAG: hypothetical protein JXB60_05290 [Candidatus Cloacimonetes bacterium]|nr:hypothetical protein [Candidatus Cloacimonadota bacterium]